MKKLLIFILSVFIFVGCSNDDEDTFDKPTILKNGEKVEVVSTYGQKLTFKKTDEGIVLDGNEDKIVLFDIFGTFCEPCVREAPALMKIQLDYNDELVLVGLSYFENVDDEYIINNFQKPHNAHYFIAKNSSQNKALVDTIVNDIKYERMISLPFKVILHNGEYKTVTDKWEGKDNVKYYIGDVGTSLIETDIKRILGTRQ